MTHYYSDDNSAYCETCKKIDDNYRAEEPMQQTNKMYYHPFVPYKKIQ
jgi:hypothetical protein